MSDFVSGFDVLLGDLGEFASSIGSDGDLTTVGPSSLNNSSRRAMSMDRGVSPDDFDWAAFLGDGGEDATLVAGLGLVGVHEW